MGRPHEQAPAISGLRLKLIEAEVVTWPAWQQEFYAMMVECGNSPVMAHMLACQRAPVMGESDRSFCETRRQLMAGMSVAQRDSLRETAARAGIRTEGKFYVGGLGRPNEACAWCSTIEDARAALKSKPWLTATGLVNQKGVDPACPPPRKVLADDLAREMIVKELKADGALRERFKKGEVKLAELREMVDEKYGYHEVKEPVLPPSHRKVLDGLRKRAAERRKKIATSRGA